MVQAGVKKELVGNKKKKKIKSLIKIFLSVRGIAIAAVVAAHSAIGLIAAESTLSQGENLTPVVFGFWQIASPIKTAILEISRFAVPLFLFLAGYHLVRSPRSWKATQNNIRNLLIPIVFWSTIAWMVSWRKGENGWTIVEFIQLFLKGETLIGYFFIILLFQYFVLSHWLIPAITANPFRTVIAALLVQVFTHIYDYAHLGVKLGFFSSFDLILDQRTFPMYLFPRFIFPFSLGIWASLNVDVLKKITEKHYRVILIVSIASVILLFVEVGSIFGYLRHKLNYSEMQSISHAWAEWKISTFFWTTSSIFLVLAVFRRWLPLKTYLETCGKNSYQILLLHGLVLNFVNLVSYKFGARIEWYGMIGFLIRFFAGLLIPILAINLIRRWTPKKISFLLLGA